MCDTHVPPQKLLAPPNMLCVECINRIRTTPLKYFWRDQMDEYLEAIKVEIG